MAKKKDEKQRTKYTYTDSTAKEKKERYNRALYGRNATSKGGKRKKK